MPNSLKLRLPEVVVPGKRTGRHVNHDLRSSRYFLSENKAQTVQWDCRVDPFDQGNLGDCTVEALLGVLATEPFYDGLPADLKAALARADIQTALAQPLYREETRLDPFPGAWEPDDTGSDGLSSAKTAQKHGWISGYTHATSLGACYTAIAAGPYSTGIPWLTGMDNPTSEGVVHATGQVRGGHQVAVVGYDAGTGLWRVRNSWGGSWAKGGYFLLPDEDYTTLLAEQGDATAFVPASQPAPTPTPTPVPPIPTPTPTPPQPGPNAYPSAEFEAFRAAFLAYDKHPYSDGKTGAMRIAARQHIAADDAWLMRNTTD